MQSVDQGVRFQYATVGFTLGLGLNTDAVPAAVADEKQGDIDAAAAAFAASPDLASFHLLGRQLLSKSAPASLAGTPFTNQAVARTNASNITPAVAMPAAFGVGNGDIVDAIDTRPPPLGGPEFIPVASARPEKPTSIGKAASQKLLAPMANSSAEIEAAGKRPYWMTGLRSITSPLLRLHNEMVELCELLQATHAEEASRRAAVLDIQEVVNSIWPQAELVVFGSFATGLYVPTSDVDLVVLGADTSNKQAALKALANGLTRKGVAKGMQVIGRARVPIIKFETVEHGGLAIDISFDVANGPEAADMVKAFVKDWPMMRPLILVLKLFLQQRELNEVYSGGIGSYGLITMVTAFLQQHRSRFRGTSAKAAAEETASGVCQSRTRASAQHAASHIEPNLAVLLVDFFRLYGRVINMPVVGISSADGGQYFVKADKEDDSGRMSAALQLYNVTAMTYAMNSSKGEAGPTGLLESWLQADRPYLLAVEDPKDSSNDISRNSFNIMKVKSAFEYAYSQLTAPSAPSESVLARILRLGPILASRPRPTPGAKHLPYSTPPPAVAAEDTDVVSINGGKKKRRKKRKPEQDLSEDADALPDVVLAEGEGSDPSVQGAHKATTGGAKRRWTSSSAEQARPKGSSSWEGTHRINPADSEDGELVLRRRRHRQTRQGGEGGLDGAGTWVGPPDRPGHSAVHAHHRNQDRPAQHAPSPAAVAPYHVQAARAEQPQRQRGYAVLPQQYATRDMQRSQSADCFPVNRQPNGDVRQNSSIGGHVNNGHHQQQQRGWQQGRHPPAGADMRTAQELGRGQWQTRGRGGTGPNSHLFFD